MDLTKSHVVDGQECVTVRESAIPIFYLKDWLVKDAPRAERTVEAQVVIVTVGTQLVGFVVDQLLGQEEVVIKPLGKMLQGTPGMAGATITGDGTIALIRSEEHTSELQSRGHLVCRLLREKTKSPRWLEERRGSLRGVSHAPQAEGRGSAATGSALQGEGRPGGRLSRARGHSASDLSPTLT